MEFLIHTCTWHAVCGQLTIYSAEAHFLMHVNYLHVVLYLHLLSCTCKKGQMFWATFLVTQGRVWTLEYLYCSLFSIVPRDFTELTFTCICLNTPPESCLYSRPCPMTRNITQNSKLSFYPTGGSGEVKQLLIKTTWQWWAIIRIITYIYIPLVSTL